MSADGVTDKMLNLEYSSINDACLQFGMMLGLTKAVPEEVMAAAIDDPLYAHHLLTCRGVPEFLDHLLLNPPKVSQTIGHPLSEYSAVELLGRASKALWNWGRTGFAVVREETYRIRYDACLRCPHLVEAPNNFLYRAISSKDIDNKICKLCGCVASKKAKLYSESCPDFDPNKSGYNRWGEPIK